MDGRTFQWETALVLLAFLIVFDVIGSTHASGSQTAASRSVCSELLPCLFDELMSPDQLRIDNEIFADGYLEEEDASADQGTAGPARIRELQVRWDPNILEAHFVDIHFYGIRQLENGSFTVHTLEVMTEVPNVGGAVGLPEWVVPSVAQLRCLEGLFHITPTKPNGRSRSNIVDLKSFVAFMDHCPTDVRVFASLPGSAETKNKNVLNKNININLKFNSDEKDRHNDAQAFAMELDSKGRVSLEINTEKDVVKMKVNSDDASFHLDIGSKHSKPEDDSNSDAENLNERSDQPETRRKRETEAVSREEGRASRDEGPRPMTDEEKKLLEATRSESWIYPTMISIRHGLLNFGETMRNGRKFVAQSWREWIETQCLEWHAYELDHPPDYDEIDKPPCSMKTAVEDPRFTPDTSCHQGRGYCHFFHRGAHHCIRSKEASVNGHGQQACYDRSGRLLRYNEGGGTFDRAHPDGYINIDWNTWPPTVHRLNVWRVSHLVEDVWPYLACCKFSDNCNLYSEVRPTDLDCEDIEIETDDSIWWL